MKQYLIVDAYNIINAWDSFREFREVSLEMCRDKLIDILQSYAAYYGLEVIVVFDAHQVKGKERHFEEIGNLQVIYTKEGETADSVIERLSHELVEAAQVVFVATSDWTEQKVVFGKGAYRKSARELYEEVEAANRQMSVRFAKQFDSYRPHALSHRIEESVREELEKLRCRKD